MIVLILVLFWLFHSCSVQEQSADKTTTINNTLDFIPYSENGKITIPGISGLNFAANTINQSVNFYNPKSNNCYFQISICLSDDTMIYQSDLIKPNETIKDIQLNQELQRGLYKHCYLVYDCFSLNDKSPLNGSRITIEINTY